MDFVWTPEQLEYRQAVVEFARRTLQDDVIGRDRSGTASLEHWKKCGEFGILGLPIPEEYGGGGADVLTTIMAMEALGQGCKDGGLLFGVNAQLWSVTMPIFRFGTEEQRRRYLPRLCAGDLIGAHGMSEPDSGSDAFSLRTTARTEGEFYILNGAKTFVSNAPLADLFLVFATLDAAKGVLGLTAFLIERDFPGFQVGKHIEKMGLKTSPMAELVFQDCRVPAENRLGREGRGALIFNDSMDWERGFLLATCLGAMQRQLDTCLAYVHERKQFGKPIGEFQSVANRLVDMKLRLEAAKLMVYRVAWARQNDKATAADAAMAKLFLSEAWIHSCLDAVQIHGGYGYMTEYEVERDLRDAIGSTLYSGTSEIQRNLIARSLGL
jgi:alkylation response protein AidB-like acyl-CoA dehydrogenase